VADSIAAEPIDLLSYYAASYVRGALSDAAIYLSVYPMPLASSGAF